MMSESEPVELLDSQQTELGPSSERDNFKRKSGETVAQMESDHEMESLKKPLRKKSPSPTPETGQEDFDPVTDFNIYATKKTIAQGLLDIALLTANITLLKHLIIIGEENHPFYLGLMICISASLILQVFLGLFLLIVGSITKLKQRAKTLNNVISVIIYLITILNVVISIFNDESLTRKYKDCLTTLNMVPGRNASSVPSFE